VERRFAGSPLHAAKRPLLKVTMAGDHDQQRGCPVVHGMLPGGYRGRADAAGRFADRFGTGVALRSGSATRYSSPSAADGDLAAFPAETTR